MELLLNIKGQVNKMEKLTKHELLKRLDNEFYDLDFRIKTNATKGVVATVLFYEDKEEWATIEEKEDA
jgi:predicted oxidoreductase (fatty acid repression mutant protein)